MSILILGYGNDKLLLWLAKRNGGVGKPEHHLVMLILPVICGFASSIGLGALMQSYVVDNPGGNQPHWFVLVVCWTLVWQAYSGILEVTFTNMASISRPEDFLAVMTFVSLMRDEFSFGMSYGIVDFAKACGYFASFGVYGGLIAFFGFLAIPVHFYADKLRAKGYLAI